MVRSRVMVRVRIRVMVRVRLRVMVRVRSRPPHQRGPPHPSRAR